MNTKMTFRVHAFPVTRLRRVTRKVVVPTRLSPEIEEWAFKISRKLTLSSFKALMQYISHYRGGKIHSSLQKSISEILIKMSQWKIQLKECQDQLHLAQIELNLRIAVYELEAVEKMSDLEKIFDRVHQQPEKAMEILPPVFPILAHGHSNIFASWGSEETRQLNQDLRQSIDMLKLDLPNLTLEQVKEQAMKLRNNWLDLNKSVIFDYRIYYAKRAQVLHNVCLLRQFLENQRAALAENPELPKIDEFCQTALEGSTPENIEDLGFAADRFREDLYQRLSREGGVQTETFSGRLKNIQAFKGVLEKRGLALHPVEDPARGALFRVDSESGETFFLDFEQEGSLRLETRSRPVEAAQFLDGLAGILLREYGLELSSALKP